MSINIDTDIKIEKRSALLAALSQARADTYPPRESNGAVDGDGSSYYSLTKEEVAALVNGNMVTIENWISSLDKPHVTWLLRWLIKEIA
jgi:hypothetical protein